MRLIALLTLLALTFSGLGVSPVHANTSMVVNTEFDENSSNGACSLREAITNANNDAATYGDCPAGSGADTITFAGNYTITLDSLLSWLPAVTSTLTITGKGAAKTIIQANAVPNIANLRVFFVLSTGDLTLDGLTVRNGKIGADGGGIYNNQGKLTVTNSTFSDNFGDSGGGITNNHGTLTVTNITFSDNSTINGGGIYNYEGDVTVTDSSFSGNSATSVLQGGGGIYTNGGTLTVTDSTFSGNSANNYGGGGGGIYTKGAAVKVINSTFSGNRAATGGGLYNLNSAGTVNVTNSTFSGNMATTSGGALYMNDGTVTVKNTIIATTTGSNCMGAITTSVNNLASDGTCTGFTPKTIAEINLGALGNNGGSTETFALLPGSAAIDAGSPTICAAAVGAPTPGAGGLDQRGVARPAAKCDIGAYEYSPGGGVRIIVRPWVIIASDGLYPERVRVDWTATAGASYYLVYRSESLDGPKLPTDGVRTTSLGGDDLWALPGVTYFYWVRACTDSGCGEFYPYNYDTGWQGLAAPLITASDGLFSDKVQLSWPAVPGASSYLGYRAESLAGTQIPANGYQTSFSGGDDLWALPGVTYFYWVKACNGLNCSPLSAIDTGWR